MQPSGMAQVSSRFTPDQVLQAGRRAEAEGRIEYAIQFYRHLTDFHPGTAEAGAAFDALLRLRVARPQDRPPRGPAEERYDRTPGPAPSDAQQGVTPQAFPAAPAWPPPSRSNLPAVIAQATASPVVLPDPVNGYRVGRWMSAALMILGWLQFAGGVAALGIAVGTAFEVAQLAALQTLVPMSGVIAGGALIAAGLATVFVSQLASAVFTTANAMQDLAAIERAKHDAASVDQD